MIPVLYVDDEEPLLELGKALLELKGIFTVDTTTSGTDALNLLQIHRYDAIISDYAMPGMNGIALLKEVRKTKNNIPFILFTGRGREEVVIQALNEGADYYLQKGGDTESVFAELSHKLILAVQRTQAEERSQVLIEHMLDGVFLSQDGMLLLCNGPLASMLGYTREEVIGKSITDLIAPEDGEMVLNRQRERLAGGSIPESYEFSLLHKDGITRIPIMISVGSGIYQNRPATLGTIRNIGAEREREDALRKSEKKFRDIYNNVRIGLFTSTPDGRFISANPYAYQNLGYDTEEEFLRSITDIGLQGYVDPEEREKVFRTLKDQGFISNYETRFFRRDGKIIWGSISAAVVQDEDGTVLIDGSCQDITDRKVAEHALQESEKRLRWVYDSGLTGIVFWNVGGGITDANDGFLEMVGYSRDDLNAGLINLKTMTPPEYLPFDAAAAEDLKKTGIYKKPYMKEFIRKDGTRIPVLMAGALINGERTSGVGFVLDMTNRIE